MTPEYERQFRHWTAPLGPGDFRGKAILDVGCGMGRNLYWPLKDGAVRAVGIDVDDRTLTAARNNLADFPHAEIRHGSAYDITEQDQFDIVFSIGVIHHLAEPRRAIARMVQAAKPGGTVLIWVYGKEGNRWLIPLVNLFRRLLVPLPPWVSNAASFVCAAPLYLFLKIFPVKKPYWRQLAGFHFWHMRSIVMDQFLPRIAHYWTRDEAQMLFDDMGLEQVRILPVHGMSWTVIGQKTSVGTS